MKELFICFMLTQKYFAQYKRQTLENDCSECYVLSFKPALYSVMFLKELSGIKGAYLCLCE